MAERNFNDPEQRDEYRRQLEDERNLRPGSLRTSGPVPTRPRRGAGPMWWWLLFLAVIIACIWLIPWGTRSNTGTNHDAYEHAPANTSTPQATTIGDLTANPKSFEGTNVVLRKATVEHRLGNTAVVVGSGNGTPNTQQSVTVLLPQNRSTADLQHGAKVQITGTLTAAPANNDNLGLSNTDAQHVRQQGYYLRASAIAPSSEAQNSGGGGGE